MNDTADPAAAPQATPGGDLAHLTGQVQAMRAVLIRLLQDVVQAESRLDNAQAARLVEANEQLVVNALEAQASAEDALRTLDETAHKAGLDPLTGLPNRGLLLDRFTQVIAAAKRQRTRAAVLFVDLDKFKQVNDSFGHAVGDGALVRVAQCLLSSVRESDTVSRHGGDEFVVLLAQVGLPADAAAIAEKVIAGLKACDRIDGHPVDLMPSIGIALYPQDGEAPDVLIARADLAMYRVKRQGGGGFGFYADPATSVEIPPATETPQQRLARYELAMDAHEQRHAQLREANEQLVLAALGAHELQEAAEHARRRQSEFLSGVVRELSSPMSPIRIATAMLGRPRDDEPLLPRAQAIVASQAEHISNLLGRQAQQISLVLGELIGAGAGTDALVLDPRRVDLAALAAEAVEACRPALDLRSQSVEFERQEGAALEIDGDPYYLAQAFTNLLANASQYTPDGGTIRVHGTTEGDTAVVSVRDTGIGIAPEALARVFEPFAQDTHSAGFNGTGPGIGLTVVRRIVEAHRGSVAASSAGRGLGSRFEVRLPRAGATDRSG